MSTRAIQLIAILTLVPAATQAKYLGDSRAFFRLLTSKYGVGSNEAATWTCISEFSSGFESAADQNGVFGVFQISSEWCSLGANECQVACDLLRDEDLRDDLECARKIREKQGLKAWEVYGSKCVGKLADFGAELRFEKRCSLARELYFEHGVSYGELPDWVCIAEELSEFNKRSLGGNYGLFQINSRYWCSESVSNLDSKGCGVPCDHFLDSQLADDIKCARKIMRMTALDRADRDGMTAWSPLFEQKCSNFRPKVDECIPETPYRNRESLPARQRAFTPCELAQELVDKHGIAREDVAPYVCVAFFDSRLVTSSTRLGPGHFGLWQIGDVWWCGEGKGCGISCQTLLQPDITEAVRCAKKVRSENGFNGWDSYKRYCSREVQNRLMRGCFGDQTRPPVRMCKTRGGGQNYLLLGAGLQEDPQEECE